MAKNRKYPTKADERWAMEDDKRQEEYRKDCEREREEKQQQRDANPIYSVCKPQGFSLWFWAVWKKGADWSGTESMPWKHDTASSHESAIAAARNVAGPTASESTETTAACAHRALNRQQR